MPHHFPIRHPLPVLHLALNLHVRRFGSRSRLSGERAVRSWFVRVFLWLKSDP